jgi:glyoxylase-like metal-dependent hydrolase (beta-lactamase superfamily II)
MQPLRAFLLLWLSLLAAPAPCFALEAVAVATDVYAFLGDVEQPSVANGGNTGNAGFIVSDDGVVVIDTGASYAYGKAMLAAIAQVTERPIRLVILTHGVQDFIFGSAAFSEHGIPLLAHRASVDLIRSRCEHCLQNLIALLGEDAMHGTRVVLPQRTVEGSTTLQVAGRRILLLHFGWGATPGDLAVFDPASGVLFGGGLVTWKRVPEMRDAKLAGWLQALDELDRLPARTLVPGHGPPAGHESIDAMRGYLVALDARARTLYDSGRTLLEAVDQAALPAYADWGSYEVLNRKNLQQRYLEYELEDLEKR